MRTGLWLRQCVAQQGAGVELFQGSNQVVPSLSDYLSEV